MSESKGAHHESLRCAAGGLMAAAGLGRAAELDPLPGGGNNRVFRVKGEGGCAFLKAYFQHPNDPRDRLKTEFSFLKLAWEHGVRSVPRPLAQDRDHGLGLYEFIPGRALRPDEVDEGCVDQAIHFYQEINQAREASEAQSVPDAAEACFNLAEHLACVERRVDRLAAIRGDSGVDREAVRFVHGELCERWRKVSELAADHAAQDGLSLTDQIEPKEKCLSPSDFGFHNTLLAEDGRLRFIDFEYAGWDDPAKVICDFFCQPALPVPLAWYERFASAVVAGCSEPEAHRRRATLLLPVYQLKWCCILLNEFLPSGQVRRRFADSEGDSTECKAAQLRKARQVLKELQSRAM